MQTTPKQRRVLQIICIILALGFVVFIASTEPSQPQTRRIREQIKFAEKFAEENAPLEQDSRDRELIQSLLDAELASRSFSFSTVVSATTGQSVTPLDKSDPIHADLLKRVGAATTQAISLHSSPDSPIKSLRRINEASRCFEESLIDILSAHPDLTCTPPLTAGGKSQRSGYPDLRLEHTPSGTVFYLDPKLVEDGGITSTFRSFYYTPRRETSKITEDAVHLVIGIEHDGVAGDWTFLRWNIADLSRIRVRLKAEFQASNFGLYTPEATISVSPPAQP